MNSLVAGARVVGIELAPDQQAAFRSYFGLLEERGRTVNLTAVRGWGAVREELFLRSLRVCAVDEGLLQKLVEGRGDGLTAIDVGTGAGIPGLVLRLALPRLRITLLDATRKKTDFLTEVVRKLGLDGVSIVNARAEEAAHDSSLKGAFDLVFARSVAKLAELAELTLPFSRQGGLTVALKASDVDDEVAAALFAVRELGGAPPRVVPVAAPGTPPADSIVVVTKLAPTPRRYPRRPGMPHQRPLTAQSTRGGQHRLLTAPSTRGQHRPLTQVSAT